MTIRLGEFRHLQQFLYHHETTQEKQAMTLERISTLKKVNRPSDAPDDFRRIRDAKNEKSQSEALHKNIEELNLKFHLVEDVLDNVRESMDSVRDVALQGTSFLNGDLERETIADEIEQMRLNVMNRLNTKHEGAYLFSGTLDNVEPFPDPATGAYAGNTEVRQVRISESDTVTATFNGEEIAFGAGGQGGTEDLLDIMANLITAFRADDINLINAEIPRLGPAIERLNRVISEVGSRGLRIAAAESHHETLQENLTSILAELEDADLAEETVNLEKYNSMVDAQFRSQGSINRQSLFDFLS